VQPCFERESLAVNLPRPFARLSQKWRNFPPRISLYLTEMITSLKEATNQPFTMSAWSDFSWFAVRCRHGMESLVDLKLRTMLIETLLPLTKQSSRQTRRTSRSPASPFFAGFLFANFCAASSLRAVSTQPRGSVCDQRPWHTGSGKRGDYCKSASTSRARRLHRTLRKLDQASRGSAHCLRTNADLAERLSTAA
jgi:hypothetical protein